MNAIRPDELDERLADGNADGNGEEPFVLDIRPADAYESGAIDGSHNLPVYGDLRGGDESALRARLEEIPRDREVVTVCKMGIVARRATRVLEEEGYDARTLAGGMSGWNGYRAGSLGYTLRSLWWRLR
ncbi:rhodanese-like domain-containing protein [Halorubrum rubrum]|uniref:Rhodanese-like domain-containing protein n=1 Tax=Halorubrum rubrum TaxID=1126240 RepID=A0ABD5R0K6_9EURY|nr:rhodanese-like domain-containing protein [Halorubrum rubrum]